jgi:hypothetical protein
MLLAIQHRSFSEYFIISHSVIYYNSFRFVNLVCYIRNIYGQIGKDWQNLWVLPTNNGYAGAIRPGPSYSSLPVPLGTAQQEHFATALYDIFDASRVVPTGPENSPRTTSSRWWRRMF